MKKILLICFLFSGVVFYGINSNADFLREKYGIPKDTISSLKSIPVEVATFTEIPNTSPKRIVCVKIDNCYYCSSTEENI